VQFALQLGLCSSRWHRNLCMRGDECPGGWFAVDVDGTTLLGELSLPTCLPGPVHIPWWSLPCCRSAPTARKEDLVSRSLLMNFCSHPGSLLLK